MKPQYSPLELPSVSYKEREKLPESSGIYYVIDDKDVIWYIGQAVNLKLRWKGKNHHRHFQLSASKNKNFKIAYQVCPKEALDELEKREINYYNPHLNSSQVKCQKTRPPETLLRETLIKLFGFAIILGVEDPRKKDFKVFEENQLHEKDYWFQKKILGLPVINIAIDTNRISELVLESDSRATPGIINSIFSTRKNYSQKWEVFGKKFQHLSLQGCRRLKVNGYLLEVSVMQMPDWMWQSARLMTLASEPIYALNRDGLITLQQAYKKTVFGILEVENQDEELQFCRVFLIKRLRLYEKDAINLSFNDVIERDPLTAFIESIANKYNRGTRGFGSRSR